MEKYPLQPESPELQTSPKESDKPVEIMRGELRQPDSQELTDHRGKGTDRINLEQVPPKKSELPAPEENAVAQKAIKEAIREITAPRRKPEPFPFDGNPQDGIAWVQRHFPKFARTKPLWLSEVDDENLERYGIFPPDAFFDPKLQKVVLNEEGLSSSLLAALAYIHELRHDFDHKRGNLAITSYRELSHDEHPMEKLATRAEAALLKRLVHSLPWNPHVIDKDWEVKYGREFMNLTKAAYPNIIYESDKFSDDIPEELLTAQKAAYKADSEFLSKTSLSAEQIDRIIELALENKIMNIDAAREDPGAFHWFTNRIRPVK